MARTRNQRKKAPQAAAKLTLLSTYRPVIDRILFALAIVGVLTTIHLWIQQGRGFDQGCWGFNPPSGEEATFNCEAVVYSDAGKLFGISNVYWGMLFYFVLAAIGYLVGKAQPEDVGRWKRVRGAMIVAGFFYSMYLVYIQFNSIGELCALCLTSAGIATLMFITLLADLGTAGQDTPAVESASGLRFYTSIAAIAALMAVVDLVYFNNLEVNQAAVASAAASSQANAAANVQSVGDANGAEGAPSCIADPRFSDMADFTGLLTSFDPTYGPEDAPVTVIEYFDPNCPHCQQLHPVMQEVAEKYQDRVQFRFIPYALRQSSVQQIEALYAAKEQGKFKELLDAQMALQETQGLPAEKVRELATEIGMDVGLLNSRLRSGLYRNVVVESRDLAYELAGVNTVPTVIVNGKFVGTRSAECISQFIEEAL